MTISRRHLSLDGGTAGTTGISTATPTAATAITMTATGTLSAVAALALATATADTLLLHPHDVRLRRISDPEGAAPAAAVMDPMIGDAKLR
ncbi:VOC family protein [Sesbania bispinosa]|nr:VOC family protein [Sesbania bispinosa]